MGEDEENKKPPSTTTSEIGYDDKTRAVRAIIESPTKFCEAVLGLKPYPYQRSFLEDRSKRIIVCAGRQVGKSLITAARALWFAISHPATNTLIISATQRQSSLMFDKILRYVELSSLLKRAVVRKSRTQIIFKNDSAIYALPCGPAGNSLRGYTAHLSIIDEAAFVPEHVITEVALPMLAATDGTMIMISTPYDKMHYFFKAFTSPHWSKYRFKTSENPRVSKDFLDQQREEVGELKYMQEYEAAFVDDDQTYFPMALLRSSMHLCATTLECEYCSIISCRKDPQGSLYAGYDPGGLSDPAALVVVQKFTNPDNSKVSFRVVLSRTYLREKDEDGEIYTRFTVAVSDLHRRLHFNKVVIDSTGLGSPIVEHAKQLGMPAQGINLSSKSKEEILSNLRILFGEGRIVLPDDLNLFSNLNCITADRTRVGGYSFSHASGTHDDLGYALALAVWAAKNYTPTVIFMKPDKFEVKQ